MFLLFQKLVETVNININTLLGENFSCKVNWKTVGIVELKCVLTAEYLNVLIINNALQKFKALVNCFLETLFLNSDNLCNKLLLFF